jgi:folate-binding protein YgfZ
MNPALHFPNDAFFDLSARTKLRVTGADRLRYLNGQISNDLRKATENWALHACVLTAKGKINAEVFIVREGESFLIDSGAEMREQLAARLERYVIADDVLIEDVTEQFALLHLIGDATDDVLAGSRAVESDRYGVPGMDLWTDAAKHDLVLQSLRARFSFCSADEEEALRIERGIPRWGHELTEEIIPTEANLESSTIDYAKGCYIGQEVISRIKMSGQTNKRLCGLITTAAAGLRPGLRLFSLDARDAGWVTSVAMSKRLGKQIALGFVKRGFGDKLTASSDATPPIPVQVVALPFA